jgi:hypothetical protein
VCEQAKISNCRQMQCEVFCNQQQNIVEALLCHTLQGHRFARQGSLVHASNAAEIMSVE